MNNAKVVCAGIVQLLRSKGITPIVYGSVGVSLLIGPYQEPDDVDLLVEDQWLNDNFPALCEILLGRGYKLFNEREHEFKNERGEKISFASIEILERDKICDPKKDLISVDCAGQTITTLNLKGFLAAYSFSQRDGYRQAYRTIKDSLVVSLLKVALKSSAVLTQVMPQPRQIGPALSDSDGVKRL